jgi:hypothetical protein
MELKLARIELDAKPATIAISTIIDALQNDSDKMYYFDKENPHKDLVALVEKFEELGYSVYLREIKYGLDDQDYMYQVHFL